MRKDKRPQKVLLQAGVAVLLLAACFVLWSCHITGDCRTFLIKALPSRGEKFVAVITQFGCGATTHDFYSVKLLKGGEDVSTLEQDSPQGLVFSQETSGAIDITWLGPGELLIDYDPSAKAGRAETEVYGVKIKYRKWHRKG